MKAIQLIEPQKLQVIELEAPSKILPHEVLVRTHRMGICGTDYSGYLGKFPFFQYPRVPGHELGVEVVEVGSEVTHLKVGDRCSVEPYMNCGSCFACRKGKGNCCESLNVIGVMVDGGLCDYFVIRGDKLHPSANLRYEQLALVETLAIGCHATDRAEIESEDQVLIIGAGPIGLATLEFVRLTGAKITIMDMVQSRLDFCNDCYELESTILFIDQEQALDVAKKITGGDRYSVVIDATGNHHSMSSALQFVAHSGTLVYVGITTQELSFLHTSMHRPEMTIKSARNALPGDFTRIIGLIEQGEIDTDVWITNRIPFADVVGEFESLTKPDSGVIKAVISVTE